MSSSSSSNVFVLLLTALVVAPVSAALGVLGWREFKRHQQEQMFERAAVIDQTAGAFTSRPDEPPFMPDGDPETITETCGLCGHKNEVSIYNASPECDQCGNTGGLE